MLLLKCTLNEISMSLQSIALPLRQTLSLTDKHELQDKIPRLVPRRKPPPKQSTLLTPVTHPLPAAPELYDWRFTKPIRRILSPQDYELFEKSPTYSLIISFVFSLSEAATDKRISEVSVASPPYIIKQMLSVISTISQSIEAYPPVDQGGSRFGNASFRSFLDALQEQTHSIHKILGISDEGAIAEISTYFQHSFGNRQRIDYGSGHELNFVMWLLCLNRVGLLLPPSFSTVTLLVFPKYLELLRKLQSTYYLEPAGSHGVWGLDDYHFLPFLFGASQLLHHPYITPLSIHNDLILEEEGDEYLYLSMVRWTMAVKSVKGLKWTQPMLDDISGAKNWGKVEQGMRRMFVKEVLGKLPVMQHFLFGSLIPAVDGMTREGDVAGLKPEAEEMEGGELAMLGGEVGHVHRDNAWGDCCGIKIPSTVAAAEEAKKKGDQDGFRRIPFD